MPIRKLPEDVTSLVKSPRNSIVRVGESSSRKGFSSLGSSRSRVSGPRLSVILRTSQESRTCMEF